MARDVEPPEIAQIFVGRRDELEWLRRTLDDRAPRPSWIVGPAGSGKTALVRAYVEANDLYYRTVIHTAARDLVSPRALPAIIAARLGRSVGERVLRARGGSAARDETSDVNEIIFDVSPRRPILVAIDELDAVPRRQMEQLVSYSVRWPDRVRFILIARSLNATSIRSREQFRVLQLGNLNAADALEMLQRRLEYAGEDTEIAAEVIRGVREAELAVERITPRLLIRVTARVLQQRDVRTALGDVLLAEFRETTNLVITPETDRMRVVPTAALAQTDVVTPSSNILTASPLIAVPSYQQFWRSKLDRLEELASAKTIKETELQQFFEDNDFLLRGIEYERVIAHPILERDDDGDLIPDFFLKLIGNDFIDILDLKLPTEKLIVGPRDRKHASAAVAAAIAQVREYRAYFDNPVYRKRVRDAYGVTGYRPGTVVVIGRTPGDVSEEKRRRVFDELPPHLRLVTYDDLLARMRRSMWQNRW